MMRWIIAIMAAFSVGSCLAAGTASIGSVVSKDDLWIDHYRVQTSGTIFNGSEVQTGTNAQSIAEVRMGSGAKMTFYGDSRGTLYRDHLVLLRGAVELAASPSFRVEVTGLAVSASEPHSSGTVSIGADGAVEVSARTGNLHVVKYGGSPLAEVGPQEPLAFFHTNKTGWRIGTASPETFRESHHCYGDSGKDNDDRDCGDHHRHRSR